MLFDGIRLVEGSELSNLVVATGAEYPSLPDEGELFYATGAGAPTEGLYVYDGSAWQRVDNTLTSSGDLITLLGYTPLDVAGDTMTGDLVLNADPTLALGAATKQYVDAVGAGLTPHTSVRVATTANIALSGLLTIDGVTVSAGNRVLVKNQTTGSENGVYVAAVGAWTRATDFDGSPANEVTAGDFLFVREGTTLANTGWAITTEGTIVVGTTAMTFAQVSSSSAVTLNNTQVGYGSAGNLVTGTSNFTFTNGTNTLTLGNVDSATGIIAGRSATSNVTNAGNISIRAGSAVGYNAVDGGAISIIGGQPGSGGVTTPGVGGSITITGGTGGSNGTSTTNGGNIIISGGLAGSNATSGAGGYVSIFTAPRFDGGFGPVERLRITAVGEWRVNGSTGTSGQVLTSAGAGSTPTWTTISSGGASLTANQTFTGQNTFSNALFTIGGTGNSSRIQADFSSSGATRTFLQTSTTNGVSNVGIIANGTGASSRIVVFNSSNPAAASLGQLIADATSVRIDSGNAGASNLPITFSFSNTETLRILTSGAVSFGASGTATGTSGQVLTSAGSGASPTWNTLSVTEANIPDGSLLARNADNETITGNWTFNNVVVGATPTANNHLATKQYVDTVTGAASRGSVGNDGTVPLTLTSASPGAHTLTSTAYGQWVTLPDATTCVEGTGLYSLKNIGAYSIPVRDNGGELQGFIPAGGAVEVALADNAVSAGKWILTGAEMYGIETLSTITGSSIGKPKTVEVDSNRTLLMYVSNAALLGIMYDKTTNTFGSQTVIRAAAPTYVDAIKIDTDKIMVVSDTSGNAGSAVILTLSGSSITVNTAYGFSTSGTVTPAPDDTTGLVQLDGGSIVFVYHTTTSNLTRAKAFTVSGTVITIGSDTTMISGISAGLIYIDKFDSNNFIVFSNSAVNVASVSGTSITPGTSSNSGYSAHNIIKLDTNKWVQCGYYSRVVTASGTVITAGSSTAIVSLSADISTVARPYTHLFGTKFMTVYPSMDTFLKANVWTVSGTVITAGSAVSAFTGTSAGNITRSSIMRIDEQDESMLVMTTQTNTSAKGMQTIKVKINGSNAEITFNAETRVPTANVTSNLVSLNGYNLPWRSSDEYAYYSRIPLNVLQGKYFSAAVLENPYAGALAVTSNGRCFVEPTNDLMLAATSNFGNFPALNTDYYALTIRSIFKINNSSAWLTYTAGGWGNAYIVKVLMV